MQCMARRGERLRGHLELNGVRVGAIRNWIPHPPSPIVQETAGPDVPAALGVAQSGMAVSWGLGAGR
eukprot:6968085-Pyramimonas_sp.AAC.1